MKQLSNEAIAELGIHELFDAKLAAFIPVYFKVEAAKSALTRSIESGLNGTKPKSFDRFGVGIAVANEPGYTPINGFWCHMPTYDDAVAEATRLNEEVFDIDQETMIDIQASSMVAAKLQGDL